ncbi:hypothetical protein Alg215_11324 [Pyrenophora tritici-repentis]|nr:hypothetical protein Alg215_11324 [Pyrenophora tritici-repentis]
MFTATRFVTVEASSLLVYQMSLTCSTNRQSVAILQASSVDAVGIVSATHRRYRCNDDGTCKWCRCLAADFHNAIRCNNVQASSYGTQMQ